ncbi:MAG: putative sugar nucleotidyl transferase [Planctomycetia bacterium]|jgi:UDP-N-acetylglucosamine diphosphorylase/glucosamine-1-phosphate N-acetyltransferase
MNVFVFEDQAATALGVLVAARPACDLTIGSQTLFEALRHFGSVRRCVRPHLARHLASLTGGRCAIWGGAADAARDAAAASRHGSLALLVNARVIPSRDNLFAVRSLVEHGRRCVVRSAGHVAAAVLHLSADGHGPDRRLVEQVLNSGPAAIGELDTLALPQADVGIPLLGAIHDVITSHEHAIEAALGMRIDSGAYRQLQPGLFVAPDARVHNLVAVRSGPVVVEADAEVGPFVCIDGPVWIGPAARVNPHAWLRGGTAIGRGCRVGGEIEASVLEPFSNKPHDGFLGHSHVGSWSNLAAGTITSNLKATYGPVRLHDLLPDGGRATLHTGRQFLGAFVADFVKTAINTALPCGCRIGPAAAIGGTVPEVVPAFHTSLLGPGVETSTAEQAATILERMMARRGMPMIDADRALLEDLAHRQANA